jgi:hypothetical protein
MMLLEDELKISVPCTIDVQNVSTEQGTFLIVLMRDKDGKALAHWITGKKSQALALAKAVQKFREVKVH